MRFLRTGPMFISAAALLTFVVGSSAHCYAATSFTDLNPNGTLGSRGSVVYTVYGSYNYFLNQEQFTAGVSVSLTQIDVGLDVTNGVASNIYAILYSSISNAPGSVLGTWKLNTPAVSGEYLASATGITGISLAAGTSYFLGVQAKSNQQAEYVNLINNDQGAIGNLYALVGQTTTESYYGSGGITAFDLVGTDTSVPEPASWIVLSLGLGALAAARRRAAKYATPLAASVAGTPSVDLAAGARVTQTYLGGN